MTKWIMAVIMAVVILMSGCSCAAECPDVTHEITTIPMLIEPSAVNVTVEPVQVDVYLDEAAFVSSYTDLEYLLDSDIRRFVGESDKRGWGINKIDITHLGNGVWEGKVTYNTLPTKYVEIFTFNEGFGWHLIG